MQPWAYVPAGSTARDYAAMVVAVLGTTISPYLFFWQATQEVEDSRRRPEAHALRHHGAYASEHLSRIKLDTFIGMGMSKSAIARWPFSKKLPASAFGKPSRPFRT